MATNIIKYSPFKRGDTPNFGFTYSAPYAGYNWSVVTVDAAMTSIDEPINNTGAAVLRLNQPLVINLDGSAYFGFGPTITESKALLPGVTYTVEAQLKEGANVVTTPVTGQVLVQQDYVI